MKLDYSMLISSTILGLLVWNAYKNHIASSYEKYSTFWPRFWAPSIDGVVLWLPQTLLPFVLSNIFYFDSTSLPILYGAAYCSTYFYSVFFHAAYGATIGKMTTKIKVVDAKTGQSITLKQAFLRDSIPFILSLSILLYAPHSLEGNGNITLKYYGYLPLVYILWFFAEVVTMLTNKKRRALHDFIAGTVVIRSNTRPA